VDKSRGTYKERSQYSCNYNECVKALATFTLDPKAGPQNDCAGLRISYAGPAQIGLRELQTAAIPVSSVGSAAVSRRLSKHSLEVVESSLSLRLISE
jgi:hypothetical protein